MPEAALTASAISILRDLVAFDTTSRLSNLALIAYVEQYLQGFGIGGTRVPNADGSKCSLVARIGPDVEEGVILSGHTDVVPIDGQDWNTKPFELTESLGKLYGRGTSDMKGFVALTLAMVPHFLRANLRVPLHFAFSYDEEVGCLGAPDLVRHITQHIKRPSLCIVGEPTLMKVVTAHKGVYAFETIVTGKESHSSTPQHGINAVQIGCELVAELARMARHQAESGAKDARFDPDWSTIHVGTIAGGTARNIIPKTCRFVWEIRPLPGDNAEAMLESFTAFCNAAAKRCGATIQTNLLSRTQGMQLQNTALAQPALACAQANETHAVSFGTEAGVFQAFGIPVLVCGPGSIDQAHKPNEFIEVTQLEKGLDFLIRLSARLS